MIPALFDHLWQSTLFAALVAALTLLLRRNGANVRYGLWLAASIKFLIPFSVLFALGRALAPQLATFHSSLTLVAFVEKVSFPLSAASASAAAAPALTRWAALTAALPEMAAILWAAGSVAVVILGLSRWIRVQRLARDARPLPTLAPIPVKVSTASVEPGVIGLIRPVLVLPDGLAERLSEEEFRAVLAHELCHVRRRDNVTAAAHMVVEAIFWFFPVVWWIGARLILEREHACDESVLASGHDPATYAESILKVCKFYLRAPVACMAGVSGANLKERLEAIMNARKIFPLRFLQRAALALAASATLIAPLAFGLLSIQAASAAGHHGNDLSPQAIAARRYEQTKPRTAVSYNPKHFDRYVGYYQLGPEMFFHVWRNGSHYMTQLTGQPSLELYPDRAGEFFSKIVPAQITFNQNADGTVTGLVLHQNGLLQHAKRVSAATAQKGEAALMARIKRHTPSPGTEAAVRHQIAAMIKGQADYSAMAPALAIAARQQAPLVSQMFAKLGSFKSLRFKGVSQEGFDVYEATFAQGRLDFQIAPLGPHGKIRGLRMSPAQP